MRDTHLIIGKLEYSSRKSKKEVGVGGDELPSISSLNLHIAESLIIHSYTSIVLHEEESTNGLWVVYCSFTHSSAATDT